MKILAEVGLFNVFATICHTDGMVFLGAVVFASCDTGYALIRLTICMSASISEQSLKIKISLYGNDSIEVAKAEHEIGNVCNLVGGEDDLDRAMSFYQSSLMEQRKILGANHPGLASAQNKIGNIHEQKGEMEAANEMYNLVRGLSTNRNASF